MIAIVVVVIVLIIVALLIVRTLRRRPDPVDSFRRQIDALSPEARRPTVDQVRDAADEPGDPESDDR